jgi:hypothetical protein
VEKYHSIRYKKISFLYSSLLPSSGLSTSSEAALKANAALFYGYTALRIAFASSTGSAAPTFAALSESLLLF